MTLLDMKKSLCKLMLLVLALAMAGCSKNSYVEPPVEDEEEENKPYVPAPLVEGRAVIAYVTYYGST